MPPRFLLGVVATALIAVMTSCDPDGATTSDTPAPLVLTADLPAVQPGDLVFRRGEGLISRAVLSYDTASPFSHVGVAALVDGQLFVVHVVPEAAPGETPVVRAEPLRRFASAAASLAVYRLRDSLSTDRAAQAARHALAFAHDSLAYDAALSLQKDDALYCTELVWKAYLRAGIDLAAALPDTPNIPFLAEPVLLPSALLRSDYLTPVFTLER